MTNTINQNMAEAKVRNNNFELTKLQPYNLTEDILRKIEFHTIKYKTIIEIINQKGKTNIEKLEEWYQVEIKYNWLIDMKLYWGFLINPDPEMKNKTKEEKVDLLSKATLEMIESDYHWKYTRILNI